MQTCRAYGPCLKVLKKTLVLHIFVFSGKALWIRLRAIKMDGQENSNPPVTNPPSNTIEVAAHLESASNSKTRIAESLGGTPSASSETSDTSSSDESSSDSDSDEDFKCTPHALLKNCIYPWWFMRSVSDEDAHEHINFPCSDHSPTLLEPFQNKESKKKHATSKYLTDLRFTQLNALVFGGRWSSVVRLCDDLLYNHLNPDSSNSRLTNVLQSQLCETMAIAITKLVRLSDMNTMGLSPTHAIPYALSLIPSTNTRTKKSLELNEAMSCKAALPAVDWTETNISALELLSRVVLRPHEVGTSERKDVVSSLEFLLRAVAIHVRAPILWQKIASLFLSLLCQYLHSLPNFERFAYSKNEFAKLLDSDKIAETLSFLCFFSASRACALVLAMLMTPRSDNSGLDEDSEKKEGLQHELSEESQIVVLWKIIVEENFGCAIANPPVDIYPDIPWPCYPINTSESIAKIDGLLQTLGIQDALKMDQDKGFDKDRRRQLASLICQTVPSSTVIDEAMRHKETVYQVVRENPRKTQKDRISSSNVIALQSEISHLSIAATNPDILQNTPFYVRFKVGLCKYISGLIANHLETSSSSTSAPNAEVSDEPLRSFALAKEAWGVDLLFEAACKHVMRSGRGGQNSDSPDEEFNAVLESTSEEIATRIASLFVGSLMSVGQAGRCIITNLCTDFSKAGKLSSSSTALSAEDLTRAERARQRENPMNL